MRVVGIDLGTTNSVVAYVDDAGLAHAIADEAGRRILPSAIWFPTDDPNRVEVGDLAKRRRTIEPANVAVLFKRGMGITLEESLNACEYVASEGNPNIVFCLRGVKSHLGEPHRNLVDFAHVPVVKRLTRMPVGVDPSHSVGRKESGASDGLFEK